MAVNMAVLMFEGWPILNPQMWEKNVQKALKLILWHSFSELS